MKIKFTKKRASFEKVLRRMGYRDRSPILQPRYKKGRVLKHLKLPQDIEIYVFTYYYYNKKSYLWKRYCDLLNDINQNPSEFSDKKINTYIKETLKGIVYKDNKTNPVCEVGWEVEYWYRLNHLQKSDLPKIYYKVMSNFKSLTKNGCEWVKPVEGGILISHPYGWRLSKRSSDRPGLLKRSKINKRFFNMSDINSCGDQFAIYDKDHNLHPTI